MTKKRLQWGLLSTARINERLIPCLKKSNHNELLAIASRSRNVADHYAESHGISRAYASYESMLEDPDIDVVYLSLPNSLHKEWVIKCAEAGKHVLCEKPLAISPEEVSEIAEAAKKNEIIVQEAAMMRFHAQTSYVRELVVQEKIGIIRMVRGLFSFTLKRPDDYRFDSKMGGGSLWDLGSYCVSFSRAILGAEPVEVYAIQNDKRGVDLSFSGHLVFSSGVFFHFFSSFDAFAHIEADLLGTEGHIYLDMPWLNRLNRSATIQIVCDDGSKDKSTFSDGLDNRKTDRKIYHKVNAYQDEVESMTRSILYGETPVISLKDSFNNISVITALYQSAREGKPIRL